MESQAGSLRNPAARLFAKAGFFLVSLLAPTCAGFLCFCPALVSRGLSARLSGCTEPLARMAMKTKRFLNRKKMYQKTTDSKPHPVFQPKEKVLGSHGNNFSLGDFSIFLSKRKKEKETKTPNQADNKSSAYCA